MADTIILTASQCRIGTVIWDLDWLGETEIAILNQKHPAVGPFVFLALICEIGKRGGFLPMSLIGGLEQKTGVKTDEMLRVIDACRDLDLLQATEWGITSRRVQREIEKFMRMRLKKKASDAIIVFPWSDLKSALPPSAGKSAPSANNSAPSAKKLAPSAGNSAPTQVQVQVQVQDQVQVQVQEGAPGANNPRFKLPPTLDTPGIRQGFELWRRKCDQNKRPLDEIGFDAICARYNGRPKVLEEALIYSAGLSRCFNLVEKGDSGPPHAQHSPIYEKLFQDVLEASRRYGFTQREAAVKAIPSEALPAVNKIGWRAFCESTEQTQKVLRSRFFEELKNGHIR